jgi:hypothetical protein
LQKFVPVVLPGQTVAGVPDFLTPSTHTVYFVEEFTPMGAEKLLRFLLAQPELVDTPLGVPPVFGTWRPATGLRSVVEPASWTSGVGRRTLAERCGPAGPARVRTSRGPRHHTCGEQGYP